MVGWAVRIKDVFALFCPSSGSRVNPFLLTKDKTGVFYPRLKKKLHWSTSVLLRDLLLFPIIFFPVGRPLYLSLLRFMGLFTYLDPVVFYLTWVTLIKYPHMLLPETVIQKYFQIQNLQVMFESKKLPCFRVNFHLGGACLWSDRSLSTRYFYSWSVEAFTRTHQCNAASA